MRYNKQIDLVGDSASKRLVVKNIYGLFLKSFFMKKGIFLWYIFLRQQSYEVTVSHPEIVCS